MNTDETTITIMEQSVPARHDRLSIDKLHFLPDNPRVYAAIREMPDFADLTPDEQQLRIYHRLLEQPSVKNLMPEILRDRGLQEPIIVRWDTMEVIEGNSRLAAYRKLDEKSDDDDWTHIPCRVVHTLTDDQQTRLLGQTHLHGKTEWSPYAKALFCFRFVVEQQRDILTLERLSGFTTAEIKKNVKIIELMQQNNDNTLSNFSYYNVLVRNQKISSAIDDSQPLRDRLLSEIETQDFTAQEMRTRLPTVLAKPKILRKYEKGGVTLEEAYDRAKISGAQQKLKKIRDGLDDIERDDLMGLERHEVRAVQQVVKQIRRRVTRVAGMVEAELAAKSSAP